MFGSAQGPRLWQRPLDGPRVQLLRVEEGRQALSYASMRKAVVQRERLELPSRLWSPRAGVLQKENEKSDEK